MLVAPRHVHNMGDLGLGHVVAVDAADPDAARAARDVAASIAARGGAGPDSELGQAVAALRDALNQ